MLNKEYVLDILYNYFKYHMLLKLREMRVEEGLPLVLGLKLREDV